MPRRELPMAGSGERHAGRQRPIRASAAVERPRDAYREVPILKRPTWGHEISGYFFFGGISSGATALGAIALLVDRRRWGRLGRTGQVVGFLTLLPCPPLLIMDLGRPERFFHMLRIFKPSSPMNLGSWVLTTHGGLSTLSMLALAARADRLPVAGALFRQLPERPLAALGLVPALALGGYTGVLLGTTAIPVWYSSPLLGGLFMASAITSGLATIVVAADVSGHDERAEQLLARLALQAGLAELGLIGAFSATSGPDALRSLRSGPAAPQYAAAIACTIAGVALEAVALRTPRSPRLPRLLAVGLSLAGALLLRTSLVDAGKASAQDREGTLRATAPRRGSTGWGALRDRGGTGGA